MMWKLQVFTKTQKPSISTPLPASRVRVFDTNLVKTYSVSKSPAFYKCSLPSFVRHFSDLSKKPMKLTNQSQPKKPSPPSQPPQEIAQDFDSPVLEVNMTNFNAFVAQSPLPVLLDCYANWCQPCKELTPKLEQIVNDAGGSIRLAKLNVDTNPEITQQLQVTELPTVFAFFQGKLLTKFDGAVSDAQLKEITNGLLKLAGLEKATAIVNEANDELKKSNVEKAAQLFNYLYTNKTLRAEAIGAAGLARCALHEGDSQTSKSLLDHIRKNFREEMDHPEVKKALAAYELTQRSEGTKSEAETQLAEAVKNNPDNLQTRYDLALAYFKNGRHKLALEECFEIISRDKQWQEQAAKKLVLQIFDVLGNGDELVKTGRKKLANLWFLK